MNLNQELVEDADPIDEESTDQDSRASTPNETSSIRNHQSQDPEPSTSRQHGMHITVQRAQISSTTAQEATGELEGLDVEIYDQQTYEKGVFEQVNQAVSAVDSVNSIRSSNRSSTKQNSNATDLIRLIHANTDKDLERDETSNQDERDEQVIKLTRQERLNRTIKTEKIESASENCYLNNIPKIPRVPKTTNTDAEVPYVHIKIEPGTSKLASKRSEVSMVSFAKIKREHRDSSDDESSVSEYKLSANEESFSDDEKVIDTEEDEFDEDIEYETDSELGAPEDHDDDSKIKRRSRKLEDDGDFRCYQARVKAFSKLRAQIRLDNILGDGTESKKLDEMVQIESGLSAPKELWENLFEHQRTGVRWLWELHQLGTGGILGDEMGLGKTIQMIAFLTALKTSDMSNAHKGYNGLGPVVLVCPATVMHQWLLEFRKWWPPFRVAILHSTGTFIGDKKNLVKVINKSCGVLIVSYPGTVIYQDLLHEFDWHYAILDEGHKIRNPDAQVTLACKRFRTPHRIILSGSPVQNNLKELWSIFDFIYPGKLGTLPVFMEQFAVPITQGGYANASDIQVQVAYKCACVLRDSIKPFLLRRTKASVTNKLKLPERSEQVLFCKLTEQQRKLYQAYLDSPTVRDIKGGFCQIFVGLIQLRKICNHPDLFDSTECRRQMRQLQAHKSAPKKHIEFFSEDETYGHYKKSGKMMVVDALLKLWKKQNNKVLLFTQSRQMLKLFIDYLNERDYKHLVMDGATPIASRQALIEDFNKNDDIFIFLLTTRVGGVGVNLTGANRIIIYDPDWNPSTDIQARERAWRIGQQRHVIIYRLLTAGTIEEKIYHRQVFKLYLTNRILKDTKQKRFFKTNHLHELFTLADSEKNIETNALFDEDLQIDAESIEKSRRERKARKKEKKERKERKRQRLGESYGVSQVFSDEKLQAMREKAKRISQMIALQYGQKISDQVISETEPKDNRTGDKVLSQPVMVPEVSTNQSVEHEHSTHSVGSGHKKSTNGRIKQSVKYLVKQDIYKPDCVEEKQDSRYKKDDYILEHLFKNSNISGALKHDKIETDSTADYKVVQSEAERVARDAIRALKESRRLCLDSRVGVPNWTGRNGQVAARPRALMRTRGKPRFMQKLGSCSSDDSLLSTIRKRNQVNPVSLAHSRSHDPLESDDDEGDKDFEGKSKEVGAEDIATKTREFILFGAAKSGEAQTDELLGFFKENFEPDKTAIFKAILYKICEFERRGDKGFWVIKYEFRDI